MLESFGQGLDGRADAAPQGVCGGRLGRNRYSRLARDEEIIRWGHSQCPYVTCITCIEYIKCITSIFVEHEWRSGGDSVKRTLRPVPAPKDGVLYLRGGWGVGVWVCMCACVHVCVCTCVCLRVRADRRECVCVYLCCVCIV